LESKRRRSVAKGTKGGKTRNLFRELASGMEAIRDDREGRPVLSRRRIEPARVYQLKITLMETDRPIWRRLRVPGDTTLARLDRIIQAAMGWTNSHLHTFTAGGVVYAEPSSEWAIEVRDERRARLDGITREEGEAFV
jgi:pRiA4b ORF-3-like protein